MNQSQLKLILNQYGLKASKSKGQNFLMDETVLNKIIKAADLQPNDHVLEIGPGLGVLTQQLIVKVKKVLSVELDKGLVFYLQKKFKDQPNLQLIEKDILTIKNEEIAKFLKNKNYKLVANVPYNITKPIFRKFLSYDPKPSQITVLIQKEVADKIIANDGKESVLSLSVKFYGQPQIIGYVSKTAFYPQPKVDSAILNIKVDQSHLKKYLAKISKFEEKKFWQLVKIGFSSRRKQLHNNISSGYKIKTEDVKKILNKADLSYDIRPEKLSLKNWLELYQQVVGE